MLQRLLVELEQRCDISIDFRAICSGLVQFLPILEFSRVLARVDTHDGQERIYLSLSRRLFLALVNWFLDLLADYQVEVLLLFRFRCDNCFGLKGLRLVRNDAFLTFVRRSAAEERASIVRPDHRSGVGYGGSGRLLALGIDE